MKGYYETYLVINTDSLTWMERDLLPRAHKQDYEVVKLLTLCVASAIEQGVELPPALRLFLTDALRQIAAGGSPAEAFFIKRKRGGRDTSISSTKALHCVFKVKSLLKDKPGLSVESACAQVANDECTSEHTVQAAWRDYRHCVEMSPTGICGFIDLEKAKKQE